jgi:hypothetical protein
MVGSLGKVGPNGKKKHPYAALALIKFNVKNYYIKFEAKDEFPDFETGDYAVRN